MLSESALAITQLRTDLLLDPGLLTKDKADVEAALPAVAEAETFGIRQREREATIDRLLHERGIYGEGLPEAYSEYGKLHFDNGNYQQAAQLFRQAWHTSRVNAGLYSETQLSYLNSLIESLIELEHWEEVHDLHQLGFLVASRIYPPDDIRYLIAAEFYASWKWQAIEGNHVSGGYRGAFDTAQQLSAFYTEVIDKAEHADSAHTERLVSLVLGKARTDISIARALLRSHAARSALGSGRYITETECFDADPDLPGPARRCRQVQLALYEMDEAPAFSVNFALGRYLTQVNQSVARLERIKASTDRLQQAERDWIDSLINTLHREAQGLSRPPRQF
jgi:tetratricopeptide (TPR) repeat protein